MKDSRRGRESEPEAVGHHRNSPVGRWTVGVAAVSSKAARQQASNGSRQPELMSAAARDGFMPLSYTVAKGYQVFLSNLRVVCDPPSRLRPFVHYPTQLAGVFRDYITFLLNRFEIVTLAERNWQAWHTNSCVVSGGCKAVGTSPCAEGAK
jgi:hypothetical protein